jgi:hypothetical protein
LKQHEQDVHQADDVPDGDGAQPEGGRQGQEADRQRQGRGDDVADAGLKKLRRQEAAGFQVDEVKADEPADVQQHEEPQVQGVNPAAQHVQRR